MINVLEGEIGFEIVVLVEIEWFAVLVAPVFVVFQTVGLDFVEAEFGGALFVLLRRAERREQKGVVFIDFLADIQHVGPCADICAVDIAVAADIRTEEAYAPAFPEVSGIETEESFSCAVVGDMRPSFHGKFLTGGSCDDVYGASDGIVRKHGTAHSLLDLYGVCGIRKAHPVVPEHVARDKARNRDSVQQDRNVFLFEAADIDAGVPVASRFRRGIYSRNGFYQFGICTGGRPCCDLFMVYCIDSQRRSVSVLECRDYFHFLDGK